MKIAAHPFEQLLGLRPARLPASAGATLVIDGRRVAASQDIAPRDNDVSGEDPDAAALEQRRLRQELARVRDQQRYQRERCDPAAMAKRKAWHDAHREQVREYQRQYRAKHRERQRELAREWSKRVYHADPAAARAKQRQYYAANRERILARLQAQRDAAKAAQQPCATDPSPSTERTDA